MCRLAFAFGSLTLCSGFSVPRISSIGKYPQPTNTIGRSFRSSTTTSISSTVSSDEDLLPGIAAIKDANADILKQLDALRKTSYFRLFTVDILASCEYMPQELFECYSETCEVYPVDEEEVPESIREVDFAEQEFEMDGWARWDMPSNDYYDTEKFPEGYTGYDGSLIWNFIHGRICFEGYDYDGDHWKADFNKAVSGLHSVVSAQVVRGIRDKIEDGEEFTDDEVWRDPRKEFDRRLSVNGETTLAIENLYFAYMLLLSAAAKAKNKLLNDCEAGKLDSDASSYLQAFFSLPVLRNPSVEVAPNRFRDHAKKGGNTLWEARMRTRELLRVINCVQCNKCRLHGKIAMMGLSTALQIHLGRTGHGEDPNILHRVELATLISTLFKFARAVEFCNEMT